MNVRTNSQEKVPRDVNIPRLMVRFSRESCNFAAYFTHYVIMKKEIIHIPVDIYEDQDNALPAEDALLIEEAKAASKDSYAPYSKFHVGAALRLADGTIVRGSNQENAATPAGCCAERTALYYAGAQYPNTAPTAIAVAIWREKDGLFLVKPGSPCGICRQHLVEAETRYGHDIRIILYGTECTYVLPSAKLLLPLTFTKDEL